MSVSPATLAAIDAAMARYMGAVPGASLLVRQNGADVVKRGYGLADVESGVAATERSNYRLASVSKQFTAAAVLWLAERGRLGLDDRLRGWLPSLPGCTHPITLRDVLVHRSGLVDYEDLAPPAPARQILDADVLALLESCDRLLFPPGSAWRYSNSGYALLALVVERASDRRFAEFLREVIFGPLGMQGSLAREDDGPGVPERAYGYSQFDGHWRRTDQGPTTAVLGDGGIYSSVADLSRWDAAWEDSRLLNETSRRMATSPWSSSEDPGVAYGFGWRISGERLWHSGESLGFRNVLVRFPARRLTVALLSNRDDPEPHATALAIARLLVG
jgi:CubicO group peptidase (beta-lactamase class C family)